MSGEELNDLVKTYPGLGWHRKGSEVDAPTAERFAGELEIDGDRPYFDPTR